MTNLLLLVAALSLGGMYVRADTTDVGSILATSVVVTSVRASDQAPITQATLDSLKIVRTMVGQDVEYVLEQTTPSIVAYSESGTGLSNYGSFRLRGIDQTRVNVTLNGAPLNDMIDQGVFFSNITDLLNGMHSVQVQRGIGTTGNGTASFAGSVSIESAMPVSIRPAARLQFSTGSFGLLRGSAEVSTGTIVNNLAATAKISTFTTNGYRYNTGTEGNSGMVGFSLQEHADLFRFTAVGGNTQNELGYLPVPQPLAQQDPRTNINDSTDHDNFGQYLLQAEWTHALGGLAAFSTMVYAGGAGGDYYSGFRDSTGSLTQINYPLSNRQYGVLATITMPSVADNLDLTAGVHGYLFNRRNWETVSPEDLRAYYADSTEKNELSGFVKFNWLLNPNESFPQYTVQGDVQLRTVRMNFYPDPSTEVGNGIPTHTWNFLNPRIALGVKLDNVNDLYASIGSTGREPTRFDMLGGTQITPANIHVLLAPNTVKPEYVIDAEIGYRLQTRESSAGSPNLQLHVNGFFMQFTNEIAPVGQYIDQYFVQLRTNVPSSKRYGVEAEFRCNLPANLTITAQGTAMQSSISSVYIAAIDSTVNNVQGVLTPNLISTAQLAWDPLHWIGADIGLRTVSSSYLELTNNSRLMLDGFALIHASLRLQFSSYRLVLQGNNLGNVKYATNGGVDYSTGAATPSVFMQATRNVWLMVEASL